MDCQRQRRENHQRNEKRQSECNHISFILEKLVLCSSFSFHIFISRILSISEISSEDKDDQFMARHAFKKNRVRQYTQRKRGRRPDTTTIASNEFFQRCLSSAFRISPDKIKIVGLPRNDMLFEKSNILDSIVGKHSYNSIGIWMPTFRQTQYGDAFDTQLKDGDLDYWDEEILTKLNEHLSCTNSFLILKLHPADIFQKKTFLSYSNIAILKNKDTSHRDLYPLLGTMDYLISDYSSVLIDFDILGKPMAFIINDIEEYTNNRGFYFDNIKEILPGKIITQENELEEFIDHHDDFIIKTDDRFNKYKDCKNRERLTEILLQETNN